MYGETCKIKLLANSHPRGNQHTGPPQWSFEKKGTLTTRSVAFPDEVSQAIEAVYSSDTLEHIHKIKAKDSDGPRKASFLL